MPAPISTNLEKSCHRLEAGRAWAGRSYPCDTLFNVGNHSVVPEHWQKPKSPRLQMGLGGSGTFGSTGPPGALVRKGLGGIALPGGFTPCCCGRDAPADGDGSVSHQHCFSKSLAGFFTLPCSQPCHCSHDGWRPARQS